jgi:stage V sporulation protein B
LGGALLLTAASLLLRLISIGFQVFLTDRIGAAGIGLLQLISTIGILAILVGTSGVRVAAMYLSAEEFGHRRPGGVREAVSNCLQYGIVISCVAGVALFFLSDFFAQSWLRDIRAASSLRIMGLLLPFNCMCGIMTGYFTACSRIRQLVTIEIAERLLSMLITVFLLLFWAGNDLEKACCAITLGSSIGCIFDFILLYAIYRRDTRNTPLPTHDLHMRKRMIALCVPLALNDYLRAGLNTTEQLLIPYGLERYGSTASGAMASYGTIHGMVFPILMFPATLLYSVSDLLVPELSRSRAMRRQIRISDLTDKCLRMEMLFGAAVAGVLFVSAPELGLLIYKSAAVGFYLRIFAPMVLILYLDAIVDGMLKGLAQQVSCVRYNTFTSLLDVLLLLILLPRWGIAGYVCSFVLTHIINLILSVGRLLRTTGHRPKAADFLRPILCALFTMPFAMMLPVGGNALSAILLRSSYFLLMLCAMFLLSGAFLSRDYAWLKRVVLRSRKLKQRLR